MASVPQSGNDNDNANATDHESNDSSKSAPQSPQEPVDTDGGGDKTAMLMMEPRLMSVSRDDVTDIGQTLRDSSSSTFQATTPPTSHSSTSASPTAQNSRQATGTGGTSKMNSNHVSSSTAAKQNDITMNNTEASTAATEQNSLRPSPLPPPPPLPSTSLPLPSTSLSSFENQASASTTEAMHATPPLSREHVAQAQASIKTAVSSIAQLKQAPQAKEDEEDDSVSAGKLIPAKKSRSRKRSPQVKSGQSNGRWTHKEHESFLEGLEVCGREWKKVASRIPTRTSAQIRSHAQKYFSKLQRDMEPMPPDGHASCSDAAAIPSEAGAYLLPSVQQNVERIIANPQAVQREVEGTLEALRERYRQLQRRLEQQQQQRRHHRNTGRVVEEDNSPHRHHSDRKRALDEESKSHDDQSSLSSNFSASLASITSSVAGARELGNEELIALQVLGGSFENDGTARERPPRRRHSSDASLASSSTSLPSDDEDESTGKRKRKEG
jgi:SHAQKYF class myb-like DNA-binding protein